MTEGYKTLQGIQNSTKSYSGLQGVTVGVIRNSMAVKGVTRVKKIHRVIRRVT